MVKNDMFYIHYPYRPDMENNVCIHGIKEKSVVLFKTSLGDKTVF